MDLKPLSWHHDHFLDALETDFLESASNTAGEHEPLHFRRVVMGLASKSEELDYLKARLQNIGLNVGQH